MKKVLVILSSVLVLFLVACRNDVASTFPPGTEILTTDSFLEMLASNGIEFDIYIPDFYLSEARLFRFATTTYIRIMRDGHDEIIQIYEFATNEDVLWYSTGIDRGGSKYSYPTLSNENAEMLTWGVTNWYKRDLIIVGYPSWFRILDDEFNDLLIELFGSQFAGMDFFPNHQD